MKISLNLSHVTRIWQPQTHPAASVVPRVSPQWGLPQTDSSRRLLRISSSSSNLSLWKFLLSTKPIVPISIIISKFYWIAQLCFTIKLASLLPCTNFNTFYRKAVLRGWEYDIQNRRSTDFGSVGIEVFSDGDITVCSVSHLDSPFCPNDETVDSWPFIIKNT